MIQRIMWKWQVFADRSANPARVAVAVCFLTVACWFGYRHMIRNTIQLARFGPAWTMSPGMQGFAETVKARAGGAGTILFVAGDLEASRGRVWREMLYPINVVFVTPEEYANARVELRAKYAARGVLLAGQQAVRMAGSSCEVAREPTENIPMCFQGGN